MKVALAVFGRFHIFDLAQQLTSKKFLNQFFTSYPSQLVGKWGIQANDIYSYPILEVTNRFHYKFFKKFFSNINLRILFDKLIKKNIQPDNDIYVCWTGAYESILQAKKFNITVVYEQGSPHILYTQKIRDEELKIVGLKDNFAISKKLTEREVLGYEIADYICVPSSFVKKSFIEHGVEEDKLIVNPYGVDLGNFVQEQKKDDIFRVIFVGRISIFKGCHYLLQAFYELNIPNSELFLIGPIDDDILFYIRKYSRDNIKILGPKPQSELYKYYSQGSVFVIMSVLEGLAMVQIQAMACGLPLICTENTGGGDIITDGIEGYILPIRNTNMLKERLFYLYKNQDICLKMGGLAQSIVKRGFSWSDYGDRMIDIYNKIILKQS